MTGDASEQLAARAPLDQLTQVLDFVAEAVTIRDRDGHIAYANRPALDSMGFANVEAMQRRSSRSIMEDYIVEDEAGNPLTIEDVPSMRLLEGKDAPPLLMRTVHRDTGAVFWRQLKTTAITGSGGEVVGAVTIIEDHTAVKTAEQRMRMLAESGRILASSLDYEQTLRNVANVAVPVLADWCAVDLLDEDLRRQHRVVTHTDPAKLALASRLREYEAAEIEPTAAMAQVLRSGRSVLVEDITDEQLAAGALSEEHLALLRQLGMRSGMIVPMSVPSRTLGTMTLITAESRRRLAPDDVELAEQLARRAAVAVENARLHTTLASISQTLSESLLPDPLPEIPGWELAALYHPAGGGQRVDVGGDFYEVFPADHGYLAIIGDVTGKGVQAAALTALLRHGARFASRYDDRPGSILRELDGALRNRSVPSLCTALCLRIDGTAVAASSAGHPPALRLHADGRVEETEAIGPLLGAFADGSWPEQTLSVSPDGMLLVYTDGVTETTGAHERFGLSRLKELVSRHGGRSPQELLDTLDDELSRFRTGRDADDVAALALRPSR